MLDVAHFDAHFLGFQQKRQQDDEAADAAYPEGVDVHQVQAIVDDGEQQHPGKSAQDGAGPAGQRENGVSGKTIRSTPVRSVSASRRRKVPIPAAPCM